jgi:hypothetical protein
MEMEDHYVKNVVTGKRRVSKELHQSVHMESKDQTAKNVVEVLFVNIKEEDQNVKNVVVVQSVYTKE